MAPYKPWQKTELIFKRAMQSSSHRNGRGRGREDEERQNESSALLLLEEVDCCFGRRIATCFAVIKKTSVPISSQTKYIIAVFCLHSVQFKWKCGLVWYANLFTELQHKSILQPYLKQFFYPLSTCIYCVCVCG